MKVSEKQLLMLVDIAKDTCRMGVVVGGYSPQIRVQLINDILNQQDITPIQVDPEVVDFEDNTTGDT
jgi:hypothetical protein